MAFLAAAVALLMASGTSRALPWPKPARPLPSPTTTSAAKPKRLPPFTVLDTRLMWTSLSISSSPPSSSPPRPPRRSSRRPRPPPRSPPPRPRPPPPPRPPRGPRPCGACCGSSVCAGVASATAAASFGSVLASLVCWFSSCILELQSAFACSVGEGFHPAMEQEAAAIEHDLADTDLLGALGESLADGRRTIAGRAGLALEVLVQGRRRGEGLALRIVDDLRIDVPARTVDRKSRLAGGTSAKRGADTAAAAVEEREIRHGYFFLPSLRKIYSPRYLMPLPLYGSGLRQRRISAATWPTCWRSMPLISTVFWSGVLTSMPSGTGKLTSWL